MSHFSAAAQHWPKAAASAAIFRADKVLIIERGKANSAGTWSLPGGHIEPGEAARDAAAREVLEETGVTAQIAGLVDVHDMIFHDETGGLRAHYVLSVFCGVWLAGDAVAASDARTARFVHPSALSDYHLTPRIAEFVATARRIIDRRL